MQKLTSFLVLVSFILSCIMPPQGFAQALSAVGLMQPPGISVPLSAAFTPVQLKGMVIYPNDPFKFDFIISRGDDKASGVDQQDEYQKLIKYFLASLAVSDTDQWVNLSPYEQDRIIPDGFGLTEMGRDLLAQDYLLKQISASLTNPDTELGKKFWDGVYEQAYQKFGTTDIPTDVISKVWVTPDHATIYEKDSTVYVVDMHLKVMMEKDYLAMKQSQSDEATAEQTEAMKISAQVMREVIIPAIEKEVNEGRNFAPVRQVYSGALLAAWYKRALKESILNKVYGDRGKVKGIDQDPAKNLEIYNQYVEAFKKGAFNMIKEDVDRYSQEVIPRKYFSGGMEDAAQVFEKKRVTYLTSLKNLPGKARSILTGLIMVTAVLVNSANAGTIYQYPLQQTPVVAGAQETVPLVSTIQYPGNGVARMKPVSVEVFADVLQKSGVTGPIKVDGDVFELPVSNKVIDAISTATVAKLGISQPVFYASTMPAGVTPKDQIVKINELLKTYGYVLLAGNTETVVNEAKAEAMKEIVKAFPGVRVADNELRVRQTGGLVVFKYGEDFAQDDAKDVGDDLGDLSVVDQGSYLRMQGVLVPLLKDLAPKEAFVDDFRGTPGEKTDAAMLGEIRTMLAFLRNEFKVNTSEEVEGYFDQVGSGLSSEEREAMKGPMIKLANDIAKVSDGDMSRILSTLENRGYKRADLDAKVERLVEVVIKNAGGNTQVFDNKPLLKRVLGWVAGISIFLSVGLGGTLETDPTAGWKTGFGALGLAGLAALVMLAMQTKWVSTKIVNMPEKEMTGMLQQFLDTRQGGAVVSGVVSEKDWPNKLIPELAVWLRNREMDRNTSLKFSVPQEMFGRTAKTMVRIYLRANSLGDGSYGLSVLDRAEAVATDPSQVVGGIDLNTANLNLQIKRDGAGVPLPISQQNLDNIKIDGLVPVILNIQPAANMPMFSQAMASAPPSA